MIFIITLGFDLRIEVAFSVSRFGFLNVSLLRQNIGDIGLLFSLDGDVWRNWNQDDKNVASNPKVKSNEYTLYIAY